MHKKNCICASKWAFTIDIGEDPVTGKRKQKTGSVLKLKRKLKQLLLISMS
ncbi:Arm DNA-binding domain-containing protein [Lysinibacillus xylanilyticus]|uniref:Arm DNA-binding domain-containing protein n=1 Tax=Lysinibacillus xylanilyticus TaxID=582475 RepID=A0ABV3W037_9BACI